MIHLNCNGTNVQWERKKDKEHKETYLRLKMAPITANSLLLRTISLQNAMFQ
jgi:hypothetical protein